MRRYQPSKTTIFLAFFGALLFLSLFLVSINFINIKKFLFYAIGFGLGTAIFFIWGVVAVIFNITSGNARDHGKPSTCTVLDKKVMTNRYGDFPQYHVLVSFVGENGKYYEHVAKVSESFFCAAQRGATLRCLVYKTSCYIDPREPVYASVSRQDR